MLKSMSQDQLRQCVQVIVETTKQKAYHSKLAYNALIALVQSEVTEAQMKSSVLPVLKKDLKGPGVNVAEAIAAVDFVLPSLELIDSRIKDWKIGIIDTIADNASGAGVILGSKATRLDGVDLRLVGCTLIKNGQIIATGAGGAVLGSPINSLVWLANTLGRLGSALDAGQVVLPGSVTAAYPVAAGDTVTANFGPLGSVTAAFGKEN